MTLGTPLLLAFLIGALVFTAYLAVDIHFGRKQKIDALKNRVDLPDDYYTPDGQDELVGIEDSPGPGARSLESVFTMLGVNVDANRRALRPVLSHAGIVSPNATAYLLFYRRFLGILIALGGVAICLHDGHGLERAAYIIVGVVMVVLGLFGSQLYVSNSKQKRQKLLTKSFPDTLDLLVVCVESGLALDAALSRVTAELGRAYPEITMELNRTRLELALLNDRSKALMNLAERTDLIPFRSLVAALIQTEKFGTSLTDTLRVLSDDYRHTRLMIAENKAGRLPALMTIPLICLLMPALFIILMGGPFIRVKQQGGLFGPAGH